MKSVIFLDHHYKENWYGWLTRMWPLDVSSIPSKCLKRKPFSSRFSARPLLEWEKRCENSPTGRLNRSFRGGNQEEGGWPFLSHVCTHTAAAPHTDVVDPARRPVARRLSCVPKFPFIFLLLYLVFHCTYWHSRTLFLHHFQLSKNKVNKTFFFSFQKKFLYLKM